MFDPTEVRVHVKALTGDAAGTVATAGGWRRHGDREALASIVFVTTSGCTWQQLAHPASLGLSVATANRRFSE
ncbi:hypothetical protein C0Q96_20350 [Streptomyces albidoflavus]|nr:hypothetical protein C0Q96_20350 [Streptomyces albidoflavus]